MKRFGEVFYGYPRVGAFLEEKEIHSIEKIESKWRKENLLLRVECKQDCYVFKRVNDGRSEKEIRRMGILKGEYPSIVPQVYLIEGDSYLMGHIDGKNFFELGENKKLEKISFGGETLVRAWTKGYYQKRDISDKIQSSFNKYRKKAAKFFLDSELISIDFSLFSQVPDQPSHNDLNAANLLYDGTIKMIDPSEEEYNDLSRDIGRYLASVFFNQYDYFGNNKQFSLQLAETFISHFPVDFLARAKYFAGESFLSFLNFDTYSTDKSVLKNLAISVLEKDKPILCCLEEGLK